MAGLTYSSALNSDAIAAVKATVAHLPDGHILTHESARAHYAQTESHHRVSAPDLVIMPVTVDDVQAIVRACALHDVPVTGWGAGSSLEGNAVAANGGVIVDFSRMNAILSIHAENMTATVQPGVTRQQLARELKTTGLFFPVDPGADASIGGMISTRASGTTTVRYGSMRDNVLALQVVMPDARLIRTGTKARKSAAGYDLTHLFTGAEGTLGLITEATIRLHGVPETIVAATWDFDTAEGAINTVMATVQCGIPIARMEFLDPAAIRACNRFSKMDLPEKPTLFLEFHGSQAETTAQLEMVSGIGADFGGGTLRHAHESEAKNMLWRARHDALPAAKALRAGAVTWVTDICVPISHLAEAIAAAQADIQSENLTAPILGHVGDGNFHVFFVLDPAQPSEWTAAKRVNESMIARALACGGTCTGEHGVGVGKQAALRDEHGDEAIAVMRTIKHALDPQNIMNPGKIFSWNAPD